MEEQREEDVIEDYDVEIAAVGYVWLKIKFVLVHDCWIYFTRISSGYYQNEK